MSIIKQLPPHEAQKIAAGEVVERPVNILKELIENSIDAHSTHIKIAVKDGGKELMRIIDNGCGMDNDDARLCFNKHATSKIQTVDQLESIQTFGFRGEALASVAAVGKVTLITKQKDTLHGTKVYVEQNSIISQEIVSCAQGTDLSVADLFYTIPARKKFLKKKETEWRHIVQLFQAFCLDYPAIHFQLSSDDKIVYNCPPVHKPADRITQLWDHTVGSHMISVKHYNPKYEIEIQGITSSNAYHRYDRNGIFFFVNNRWVKNFALSTALFKGYHNVLPHGKYPVSAILITVPATDVDINIHPRKEEVKFMHPRIVEQSVEQAIRLALEAHVSSQINIPVQFASPVMTYQSKANSYASLPTQAPSYQQMQKAELSSVPKEETFFNASLFSKPTKPYVTTDRDFQPAFKEESLIFPETEKKYQIIGQYHKTYILIEKQNGLFMVDQHAAHERILYESFKNRDNQSVPVNLLFPQLITVSNTERERIEPYLSLFTSNNIAIEPFGQNQLRITATPVYLKTVPLDDLVKQVIGWIAEYDDMENSDTLSKIDAKIHAQMACKAAVKAGDILTMQEMQKLLADLDKTQSNFCCPHGRPTGWLLTLGEIEKKFKRDYKS